MSPHATSRLDQLVIDEPQASYRTPRETFKEWFLRAYQRAGDTIAEYGGKTANYAGKIVDKVQAATRRGPRPVAIEDVGTSIQFVWSPSRESAIDPGAVICVKLPVRNPVGLLSAYMSVGVRPERVVFVGDPLTLSDAAYDGITRMGALVHPISKKVSKERAKQELSAYYTSPVLPREVPAQNPNPYAWEPGPPRVTTEQLQALIDAVRARR